MEAIADEKAGLTENTPRSLRAGVARAALASGAVETISRVLTILLSVATARALEPRDVGVLGLAVIVIGIVSLIAACSETAGVITRGPGSDRQYAVAATALRAALATALVIATYGGLSLLSNLLAAGGETGNQFKALILTLMWLPFIEAASCYPRVMMQRRLDLSFLAGVGMIQVTAHVGLSVVLLWLGYGAMGVVCSSLVSASIAALVCWVRINLASQELPGPPANAPLVEILKNSFKVFSGGFVGYLNGRIDNLLVAGAVGPAAMSFYGMAWSASRVAPQIVGQAVGFVLIPALAQIKQESKRLERALGETLRLSYLVLAPVSAALFVLAPALVATVLGERWLPMVPCLRVMSVSILVAPIVHASNSYLVAVGRAHLTGMATMAQLGVLGALIVPVARAWGILGAAFSDLLAVVVLTVVLAARAPLVRQEIKRSAIPMLMTLTAAAISAAIVSTAAQVSGDGVRLAIQFLALAIAYPAVLWLLQGKVAFLELIRMMYAVLPRFGATPEVSPNRD